MPHILIGFATYSAGRSEVKFPISTAMPGTARFQVAAAAEDFAGTPPAGIRSH
jgi:hypothetical protein